MGWRVRLQMVWLRLRCAISGHPRWEPVMVAQGVTLYEAAAQNATKSWRPTHDMCMRCWAKKAKKK